MYCQISTFQHKIGISLACQRAVVLVVVIGLYAMGAAAETEVSQTADPEQTAMTVIEQQFWSGASPEDLAPIKATLEAAARQGDTEAQRLLGLHLLNGWVLAQDTPRGLALLEQAVAAGNAKAQSDLGQAYLWGMQVTADTTRAQDLLAAAAAQGDPAALRILGEQLVGGWILARDADRGRALLDQAIKAGDIEAHLALGRLLLNGLGVSRDRGAALALFETAAKAGDGTGLAEYGEDLMWRQTDFVQAEAMLNRAAELGATKAWVTLAHGAMYGYLGGGSASRAKFHGYAEKARAAGEDEIAVLEAKRNMLGILMRASGPETIAGLRAEADRGNGAAARFLIELLRDGNNLNLRRNPTEAKAALEAYGSLLGDEAKAQYAITLKAATAQTPKAFAAVAAAYAASPDPKSVWFGREIIKANPNVAFFILQQQLQDQGLYAGPLNGFANRTTLRAAYLACRRLDNPERCDDTVMRPDVIAELVAR